MWGDFCEHEMTHSSLVMGKREGPFTYNLRRKHSVMDHVSNTICCGGTLNNCTETFVRQMKSLDEGCGFVC